MRLIPRVLLHGAALLAVWSMPAPARAEPIVITSGFLTSTGISNFGQFSLSGAGLTAVGSTDMGFVKPSECFPCTSGAVVSLSADLTGRFQFTSLVIDGVPVPNQVDGGFFFTAPSIVMPTELKDFSVRLPFTFVGSLIVLDEGGHNLFTRNLIGSGELTANFDFLPRFEGQEFDFLNIRYDFTAADPVPEPMTLLLVGSGLGGIALRKRRALRSS